MKAKLRTTFESHGKYVVGHIEDAEMYGKVKNGISKWDETAYPRITHIRIPKEVFERLLDLDRKSCDEQRTAEWVTTTEERHGQVVNYIHSCTGCNYFYKTSYPRGDDYCHKCGAKMKVG